MLLLYYIPLEDFLSPWTVFSVAQAHVNTLFWLWCPADTKFMTSWQFTQSCLICAERHMCNLNKHCSHMPVPHWNYSTFRLEKLRLFFIFVQKWIVVFISGEGDYSTIIIGILRLVELHPANVPSRHIENLVSHISGRTVMENLIT